MAPGLKRANLAALSYRRYSYAMRPLRYSINVTLDGCCDHRAMFADEDLHRHAVENLDRADALLFGRVTYEMMEAAWRAPARTGARPDWMEPFARTIDAAKKYVVSSTLDRVDWNAELVRGDLGKAAERAAIARAAGDAACHGLFLTADLSVRLPDDPDQPTRLLHRVSGPRAIAASRRGGVLHCLSLSPGGRERGCAAEAIGVRRSVARDDSASDEHGLLVLR